MKLISQVLLGLLAVQGGCVGQDEYADPDTGATSDARDDAKRDTLEVLDDPAPNEPDANHDVADQDLIANHDADEDTKDADTGEDADFDSQDFGNHDLMDDSEISDLSDLTDIHDIPEREDIVNDVDMIDVSSPDVLTDTAIDMDTSDLVTDAAIDTNTDADANENADVDAGEVQISGYDRCLAQYNAIVEQALRDHPPEPEPEPTEEPPDTFTQVSLGQGHGCALRTNGSIYCWGNNQYHQSEPPPEDHFVQVVAYENQSCALDALGHLRCWGENREDFVEDRYEFSKISKGCGLLTNGSIQCWTQDNRLGLQSVPGQFIDMSYNNAMLCAIDNQNKLQCFGDAFEHVQRIFPRAYSSLPRNDFISVKVVLESICAETTDHRLICRGEYTPTPGNSTIKHYAISPDNYYSILIYDNGNFKIRNYDGEIESFIDSNFANLPRQQWIDVDINATQHCAIDQNQQLQCWTNHGSRKQNLLYDRFLDYDFGCAVMQDRTLYCEEGEYDNFSRTTRILFDKVEFSSLVAKAGISQNQDVYYWADTFQGGPDESDVYYFQGPYENIVTEFEYFCGINENGNDECQCLCYPGYDICPLDCNERALFLYQNFYQINKNCGIDNNGSINCWHFRDFEIYNTELNNQYAVLRFTGASFCGITCEGYIQCEGTQSYYNRGTIFKDIVGYNYPVQHFCSIDIFGKLSCESPEEIYTFNGKFSKLISSNNTFCAQRENGSVFCIGHQRGGK